VAAISEPGDSFAFANLFSPHRPYKPISGEADEVSDPARKLAWRNEQYRNRYNYGDLEIDESVISENRRLYDREVAWVDENIGRLFDQLENKGLMDETVVLITGDHGELFDEPSDPPYVAHRNSLHPVLIDLPLLLYHPNLEPRRDSRLASQVDVAPTILDAMGVMSDHTEAVDKMAGYSLLGTEEHDTVFAEMGSHDVSKPELKDKYDLDFTPYHRAAKVARTHEYTVEFRSDGPPIARNRLNPELKVPDNEIDRLRTLVDEQLSWDVKDSDEELTAAVRERLEDVGYLG
jgi:arylsulfatase A-like enzyme